MRRQQPRSNRTGTLFPYTTLFRSLVVTPPGDETGVKAALGAAVDVSDNHTTIRIAGPKARWVLAKGRSEEHTSELQSLMRISYAVFCLQKKTKKDTCIPT